MRGGKLGLLPPFSMRAALNSLLESVRNYQKRRNTMTFYDPKTGFDTQEQNEYPFASMGIDKIAIGINDGDGRFMAKRESPDWLKGKIDIITYGYYSILNFQGEFIYDQYPLWSIAQLLLEAVYSGVFIFPFAYFVRWCCNCFLYGYWTPDYFINSLFPMGLFKWDELEIYSDWYGNQIPLRINQRKKFINKNSTLYSRDYRKVYRDKENPDGTKYREAKCTVRSILAIYDRSRYLNEKGYNVTMPITRLEIRICDRKAKALLNPFDLGLFLESFIDKNHQQIQKKIKNARVPSDAISVDDVFVNQYLPCFPQLIPCTCESGVSSSRDQIFPVK
jgi:hypothetical protein